MVTLKAWFVELDDTLEEGEEFLGIKSVVLSDMRTCIIGLAQKYESASGPTVKRYVNIKFVQNTE